MTSILILGEDDDARPSLVRLLRNRGFRVWKSLERKDFLYSIQDCQPNLIIIAPSLNDNWDVLEIAKEIRNIMRSIPVIILANYSSEDRVIAALRLGVNDYFNKPFNSHKIIVSIDRLLASPSSKESLRQYPTEKNYHVNDVTLIGKSQPMQKINNYISKIASADSNVLITGETGTGKDLAAQFIHRHSKRYFKQMVSINCAALPDSLLEAELFGYEKGAFTGAHSFYEGKLKLADEGTVFFDEIGDMSLYAQAKILQVIENKEFYRLRGKQRVALDIRIIAASNQDLENLVREGRFRNDLYFRLNVVNIHLPPLRQRKEDIPLLMHHFLCQFNRRFGLKVKGFNQETLETLLRYDWPGNVRELKNLLEATLINLSTSQIAYSDLPEAFLLRFGDTYGYDDSERDRLLSALLETNWNKSKVARKFHWSRTTVYRKMARFDIQLSEKMQPRNRKNVTGFPY